MRIHAIGGSRFASNNHPGNAFQYYGTAAGGVNLYEWQTTDCYSHIIWICIFYQSGECDWCSMEFCRVVHIDLAHVRTMVQRIIIRVQSILVFIQKIWRDTRLSIFSFWYFQKRCIGEDIAELFLLFEFHKHSTIGPGFFTNDPIPNPHGVLCITEKGF